MAIEINLQLFNEFLEIQKERQLAMKELSDILGYDVSFSDEEVINYAMEQFQGHLEKKVGKEVEIWMKSLFS